MKNPKISLVLPVLLIVALTSRAEPRILMVGDSWAQSIWAPGLMDKALAKAGFPEATAVGATCALGGTRAEQWVMPEYRNKITEALAAHPTVDIVHLIIGGNDVLRHIKEQNVYDLWSPEKRTREWDIIARNIKSIVNFCLEQEQIRHVVLAGYDYLNPATAKKVFALLGQNFDFGGMSQEQVNKCFIEHAERKRDLALEIERCTYIHNLGLMQYHFREPADAAHPGGPPDYPSFPGGNPALPMPDAAFTTLEFAGKTYPGDGIHPNEEAHLVMLENAINTIYKTLLSTSETTATQQFE